MEKVVALEARRMGYPPPSAGAGWRRGWPWGRGRAANTRMGGATLSMSLTLAILLVMISGIEASPEDDRKSVQVTASGPSATTGASLASPTRTTGTAPLREKWLGLRQTTESGGQEPEERLEAAPDAQQGKCKLGLEAPGLPSTLVQNPQAESGSEESSYESSYEDPDEVPHDILHLYVKVYMRLPPEVQLDMKTVIFFPDAMTAEALRSDEPTCRRSLVTCGGEGKICSPLLAVYSLYHSGIVNEVVAYSDEQDQEPTGSRSPITFDSKKINASRLKNPSRIDIIQRLHAKALGGAMDIWHQAFQEVLQHVEELEALLADAIAEKVALAEKLALAEQHSAESIATQESQRLGEMHKHAQEMKEATSRVAKAEEDAQMVRAAHQRFMADMSLQINALNALT